MRRKRAVSPTRAGSLSEQGGVCKFKLIAMGASAGGLHSLSQVLAPLPADLNCAILVVQHLSPEHKSMMAELLLRRTVLRVSQGRDGDEIRPGLVLIAPPNLHLLAEPGNIRLLRTPAVHYSRPSIDLMFNSVAASYGPRSIAVVLSGSGRDGADGLRAVKLAGGTTIAEDPSKAEFSSMPYAAIASGCVDMVLPLSKIPSVLVDLCSSRGPDAELSNG
jgi:two-component system chemotaxis response regulator CheB